MGAVSRLLGVGLAILLLLGAGCDSPGTAPTPLPSPSTNAPRPFTVMSTDKITTTDPAAVTDQASMILSLNVFQRLMTADPGDPALRPDAARDCLFTSATVYTCTLNEDETFHNGHPLTAADVKFSIQRASRLDVPGSSASLLSSLRRIETPDPLTIRFVLGRVDTQFGWALASPAASIVDQEIYDADEVADPADPVIGSGPFSVVRFHGNVLTLKRFADYQGRTPAQAENLTYRTAKDSATLEDALATGAVDVVWRGLNTAALTRYARQAVANPRALTDDGYTLQTYTGARVRMLQWSADSPVRGNAPVRHVISTALQGDRTLDSVVPGGVQGHIAAFELGGRANPDVTWGNRIPLDLAYDPTMPDGQDLAIQIRTRLEDTGGLSVRLRPGGRDADLTLVDRKAWTATGQAWLQPYLTDPLPGSAELIATLEQRYRTRTGTEEPDALRTLGALQSQAAVDATVLPVTQSDEYLLAAEGVSLQTTPFGPSWQLGLWGMSRG